MIMRFHLLFSWSAAKSNDVSASMMNLFIDPEVILFGLFLFMYYYECCLFRNIVIVLVCVAILNLQQIGI